MNFIAFTGDIAHSGKEDEYELAEEYFFQPLLKATGLSPAQLFIVPGNHDVDRSVIQWKNPDIPTFLTNRAEVNAFLSDRTKRSSLFAPMATPMANYAQFAQHFFAKSPDHQILGEPLYSYTQPIPSKTLSVALIALNSAWISGFNKDIKGKVDDRGKLLIGDKQIRDALEKAEDATVRIVLVHHPTSWLTEFDKRDIDRWLQPTFDFVLRGHLHYPDFKRERALGGDTITIPAGTVYQSREWLNGYNLVQLDFDTGKGKIVLRRYAEERHEWVRDVVSTGDALNGVVTFDLPGALAKEALASVGASQVEPSWLYLGRDRELQLLSSFLQQGTGDILWIWGDEDCGLIEFLQIARVLLERRGGDVVFFDAEDAARGIIVDQYYFLEKLKRWTSTDPKIPPIKKAEDLDERLARLLEAIEIRLVESGGRPVLIFANYHMLLPAMREWVSMTLCDQILARLNKYKPLVIFACEGTRPSCPASDQQNKIYLAEFTAKDIEDFLLKETSINPQEIAALAERIHSESTDEFLAPPRRVYRNLAAALARLDMDWRRA